MRNYQKYQIGGRPTLWKGTQLIVNVPEASYEQFARNMCIQLKFVNHVEDCVNKIHK